MTRDEEILKACKSFLSRYPSIDQAGLSIGFLDGAVWSDKHPVNVWHDASEEPQEYPILCKDEFSNTWLEYSLNDYVNCWAEYVEFHELIQWVYVSDLLPKQFGNSERLKGGER